MAIVRNIQNDDLYRYHGNNEFTNLRTGKRGVIDNDLAKKVFKINLEATELIEENPIIEEMIKRLNLKFDNIKK
jgi:hypothetical protein